MIMRLVGFEPTRPKAQEPKSCTSASFAITADTFLSYHEYRRFVNTLQQSKTKLKID